MQSVREACEASAAGPTLVEASHGSSSYSAASVARGAWAGNEQQSSAGEVSPQSKGLRLVELMLLDELLATL